MLLRQRPWGFSQHFEGGRAVDLVQRRKHVLDPAYDLADTLKRVRVVGPKPFASPQDGLKKIAVAKVSCGLRFFLQSFHSQRDKVRQADSLADYDPQVFHREVGQWFSP